MPAKERISPTKHPCDWDDPKEADIALRPFGARRADALQLLAESFLQHGPASQTTADRYQIVVHVDAATMKDHEVTLCRAHHRMVHSGEIVIKPCRGGEWIFLNQEGRPYKGGYRDDAPPYAWNDVCTVHEAQGVYINSSTAVTRWRGERMDYDMALACLFAKIEREQRFRGNVEAVV